MSVFVCTEIGYGKPFTRTVVSRTLCQFFLAQLPQLVHVRSTPGHGTFGDLYGTSYHRPRINSICCRLRRDFDHPNSRILGSTVMGSIFEVTQPGLEGWRIVFADRFTVCDDVGLATDACPFSRRVKEGDVDFGIRIQIVGLARFGVRVE